MREPVTASTGLRRIAGRVRRASLALKITALGTIVTATVVFVALWALSVETRASARLLFADELSRHQRTLLLLQRQNLTQRISSAAIITQSPTLRSALATYRLEANTGGAPRTDLVQTVERELSKLVARVNGDVLIVTDDGGRVFASASRASPPPRRGADLSGLAAVRQALSPSAAADSGDLAVYRDGDISYHVAVYPMILDGYTMGALLLGERLDKGLVASARAAFDGQIVVTAGRSILVGTLANADARLAEQLHDAQRSGDRAPAIVVNGEELLIAQLPLGQTQTGDSVSLWLMQPLDQTVRTLTRPLLGDFILYGLLAVIVAGAGAGLAARSALRPFRHFVSYMRSGAAAEQLDEKFPVRDLPAEVRSLNESYEHLMGSIATKQRDLRQRTTELMTANAVLLDEVRERKRVEDELRERDEQLRQSHKLEAIGTLAGGIAHDFNNLLTAVSGFTQLALMNVDPKGEVAADLRHVVEAADRAGRLTKQLLAFGRKQVLQPTVIDVGEVLRGIAPLFDRLLGEHITVRLHIADDLARVIADRTQLEQVIINLSINARDAMSRGGTLTITASQMPHSGQRAPSATESREAGVAISVSDTGTGIPDAVRERIFEPFFTTKEPGKGTGLGLSTVYGIVKQSGGIITVDSKVGVGTTFRITLPSVSATAVPGDEEESVADLPTGTETILLVEDDAEVRTLSRRTLEGRGYTVLPASEPLEALRLAASASIDLIVTDIVMPNMNGPEFVERFRATHPAPVVIFMSGYAHDALMSEGRSLSSAFLRKPFTPATLARLVRDTIDASKRTPLTAHVL